MRTNVFIRDRDLGAFNLLDTRRLEVVVDGLPGGAQLAVDTTLVCPLTREGEARPRAVTVSGACLTVARRRKEAWCPELVGDNGKGRLVVLAGEVGGRFSLETAHFLRCLAAPTVWGVPQILQNRAHAAWLRRWNSMVGLVGYSRVSPFSFDRELFIWRGRTHTVGARGVG